MFADILTRIMPRFVSLGRLCCHKLVILFFTIAVAVIVLGLVGGGGGGALFLLFVVLSPQRVSNHSCENCDLIQTECFLSKNKAVCAIQLFRNPCTLLDLSSDFLVLLVR